MAVRRDLGAVAARVRRVDLADDREWSESADDVADRGTECRVVRGQRRALHEHRFAGLGPELVLDQPGRAAGLAGNRVVLLELGRAGGDADNDGEDDESEPAEDRDLPMSSAPTT